MPPGSGGTLLSGLQTGARWGGEMRQSEQQRLIADGLQILIKESFPQCIESQPGGDQDSGMNVGYWGLGA